MFFFSYEKYINSKSYREAQCSVQPWHDILDGWKYNSNILHWCRVHETNELLIVGEKKIQKTFGELRKLFTS